jgi:hypothetical protein
VITAWTRPRWRASLPAIAIFTTITVAACGGAAGPTAAQTSSTTTPPSPGSLIDGPQLGQMPAVPGPPTQPGALGTSALNVQMATLSVVFANIQSMWQGEFAAAGRTYVPAQLALFESQVSTACGTETAGVGSFYCPGDRTVYLDSQLLSAMKAQFGVRGDFAEVYVVAHEVGHHIQNLVGITSRIAAADRADPAQRNALSVRAELQADCLAGVWAHSTFQPSQPGPAT